MPEENRTTTENDGDYLVRAMAADGAVRAFAVRSRQTVEEARKRHNTSPAVTAALGRLLSGGAMMGVMMKGDDDLLTLQIKSEGLMKGLTVTADSHGNVKGFPMVPDVIIPANEHGKLDVSGALGHGDLLVIKDMGLKDPYVGRVRLQTGEIAEDLTYYFAVSEQTPSSVGLGVLMSKDNTVEEAGGFIIQLMPFAEEELIGKLEKKIAEVTSVTELLKEGHSPESLLEFILSDFGFEVTERVPVHFSCNCSKQRIEKVLCGIGKEDLQKMIDEGESIEVQCHFCNTAYLFDVDELKEILKQ